MFPGGELLFSALFEFPGNQCESVIWRRYVNGDLTEIHQMGCARELAARKGQVAAGKKPDKTYIGAAIARVADIRCYRNPQGHGIRVVHEPAEGRYHVHLCYDRAPGAAPMTRADKNEIKIKLVEIFADLRHHDCSSAKG
jgi:hypothetical protein